MKKKGHYRSISILVTINFSLYQMERNIYIYIGFYSDTMINMILTLMNVSTNLYQPLDW